MQPASLWGISVLEAENGVPAIPKGMDWTDLPAYHRAVLSAHQVRAEYSLFLIDLWQEIWQSALDESSLYDSLEEQSVQKTEKSGNQQLETFSVWEYEEFYRFFEALEGFKIGLTVSCNPEDQVQLGYWVDSKYRELIETAKLGSSWHITAENSK